MKAIKYSILVYCIFLLVLGTSCTQNIYIATDNPDIVYLAEAYNNEFKNKPVTVYYSKKLSRLAQKKPFHFIAINNTIQNEPFLSSSILTSIKKISSSKLINNTKNNAKLLSFSLPLVVSLSNSPNKFEHNKTRFTLSEIQQISANNISIKNDIYSLGFYPVDESFNNMFENNIKKQEWLAQANLSNTELQTYYSEHYLPAPLITRILDNNIIYKFISSYNFFLLPEHTQKKFTIYLLTLDNGNIPAITPLYISNIKNNVNNRFYSTHFFKWIFTQKAQESTITLKQKLTNNPTPLFINNHLSSVWTSNTSFLFPDNNWLSTNQPLFSQIIVY